MDRAFRRAAFGAMVQRGRAGEPTASGTLANGIGTIRATAALWPHWRRRWFARRPNSKLHSSEDSRKFSPQAGGTEKKEFFKQPRCSAGSCWLALCKIRDSRRKSLGAFDKSSADRALAKCECHSCDLEANKFVDGRQSGQNSVLRVTSGLAVIQTEPPNSPSRRSIRASAEIAPI